VVWVRGRTELLKTFDVKTDMPFVKNVITGVSKPYSPYSPPLIIGGLAARSTHTMYVSGDGTLFTWGVNSGGQLGDNTTTSRSTPVAVAGTAKTFCKVSAAEFHSVAIDKNGQGWAWGVNGQGRLGDGSLTNRCTPVSVAGTAKTFCDISGGGSHSIAVDNYGQVWCWGNNGQGQLGNNSVVSRRTPIAILGQQKTFCTVSAGRFYSLGIDKNGQVWAWGQGASGQLGNNQQVNRCTPVSIVGPTRTFCKISAGIFNHVLAIDKNGQVWGWGNNTSGPIGDNTTTFRSSPVAVAGTTKTFCEISAGASYSLGIDKNGQVWGWGSNVAGQLGDNTITCKLTPVSIAGTAKTFCKIAAGNCWAVAIDKDGQVWAWGLNNGLYLGINSAIFSELTPVRVYGL